MQDAPSVSAVALEHAGPGEGRAGLRAKDLSDARLVRLASEGDARAHGLIFRRYRNELYAYCMSMLGCPHDASDAVQATMVSMLRALPGERREIALRPWLYRIAHNESVSIVRQRGRSVELGPEVEHVGAETGRRAELRLRLRELLDDLDALPERQRGALVMRELAGMGFDEIGRAFGANPVAAKQMVYEARVTLGHFTAGRELACDSVRRTLSDDDHRVRRTRNVSAHLRACVDCRRFCAEIEGRSESFASLAAPAPFLAGLVATLLRGATQAGILATGAIEAAPFGTKMATTVIGAAAAATLAAGVAGVGPVAVPVIPASQPVQAVQSPTPQLDGNAGAIESGVVGVGSGAPGEVGERPGSGDRSERPFRTKPGPVPEVTTPPRTRTGPTPPVAQQPPTRRPSPDTRGNSPVAPARPPAKTEPPPATPEVVPSPAFETPSPPLGGRRGD